MPPKRGRPAKQAPPAQVAAATPKRRGRPSAASIPAPTPGSVAQLKKRGRPSKALDDIVAPPAEEPKLRRGRRATKDVVDEAPPAPVSVDGQKKRAGRPRKEAIAITEAVAATETAPTETLPKRRGRASKPVVEASTTTAVSSPPKRRGRASKPTSTAKAASPPKRKGRPPKAALDLNRVVGSPRVTKRNSASAKKSVAPVPAATRINPRIRSKLRSRLPPSPKAQPVPDVKPKKRAGRPAKNAVATTPTKKPSERKTKGARVTKATAAKPNTAKPATAKRTTVVKPRKRRGFTVLEVPDKHAKYLQDVLKGLLEQDKADANAAEEEAEMADDEEEVPPEQAEMVVDEFEVAQQQATQTFHGGNDNVASKVAIAEELIEDVAGGAQEESIDGDPDEAELGKSLLSPGNVPDTFERESSSNVEEDRAPRIITKETVVELEFEEVDEEGLEEAFENELNGEQSNEVTDKMVITKEQHSVSQVVDLDNDSTHYNSLFDETPLAASTPAPPVRASSTSAPAAPMGIGSMLPSNFMKSSI